MATVGWLAESSLPLQYRSWWLVAIYRFTIHHSPLSFMYVVFGICLHAFAIQRRNNAIRICETAARASIFVVCLCCSHRWRDYLQMKSRDRPIWRWEKKTYLTHGNVVWGERCVGHDGSACIYRKVGCSILGLRLVLALVITLSPTQCTVRYE